ERWSKVARALAGYSSDLDCGIPNFFHGLARSDAPVLFMRPCVVADIMAMREDLLNQIRMRFDFLPDQKKRCVNAMCIEDFQASRRVLRVGTIVEGDGNLIAREVTVPNDAANAESPNIWCE